MANTKISDLTSGSPVQATDQIPVSRAGANRKIPASDFATAAQGAKADGALQASNNLSDLTSAATAWNNLGAPGRVQAIIDAQITAAVDFKGTINASTNPNYPSASVGDMYIIDTAGLIGGGSGVSVDVGDAILAIANNAGGTQASVGSSWSILEHNLQGALLAANNLSDLSNAATAWTNLSGDSKVRGAVLTGIDTGTTGAVAGTDTVLQGIGKLQATKSDSTHSHNIALDSSTNTVFSTSGLTLSSASAGADRILFWDESEGKVNFLRANTNLTISGTDLNASGGGAGATNLTYTASPTSGLVVSDTGTDATIPLVDGTNAGLMAPAQHTKLAGIATNANNYSHPNHTGDVTSAGDGATTIVANAVSTAKIANSAVTNAKLANIATATIKGRATTGTGAVEDLTATQVRTIINVANGATANDTDANLKNRANHTGTQAGNTVTGAYTSSGMTLETSRLLGRTTAGAGAAEEISVGSNLTLATGSLSVNTTALGLQSAVTTLVDSMFAQAASSLLSAPVAVKPYTPTGTVYYVDPTVVGPGSGTFADPWKSPTSATLAAGQALLFKEGTTTTLTTTYGGSVTGTAANPIIYGVYSASTGTQITGKIGAATITCNGGTFTAIDITDKNYIEISNLNFIGKTGSGNPYISFGGGSGNCMVRNCSFASTTSNVISIWTNGSGHVIQGNIITAGSATAISLTLATNDQPVTILHNQISGCTDRAILIYDGYNGYRFSGTIAGNVINDCTNKTGGGICIVTGGGGPKIYYNTISKASNGVSVSSSVGFSTVSSNFSDMYIESNTISNCEFGIALTGASGNWVIQGNRIERCGSYDNVNPIDSDNYGRAIELFAATDALAVRDGLVRWNYLANAYNFSGAATPGSEGVGVGIDDRCRNIRVFGNITYKNGGNGIQVGLSHSTIVSGNISIDDMTATYAIDIRLRAGIVFVASPYTCIINNTIIQTGRTNQTACITDSSFTGTGCVVRNNLCFGPLVAAVRYNASNTIESHNICVGPAVAVNMSDVVVSAGSGSSIQTALAVGAYAPMYRPVAGGPCDNTGIFPVESWINLFNGAQIGPYTKPIGAQLVQY